MSRGGGVWYARCGACCMTTIRERIALGVAWAAVLSGCGTTEVPEPPVDARVFSWVTVDPHLHLVCENEDTPDRLVSYMQSAEVQIGISLVSNPSFDDALGVFAGTDDAASLPDRIFHQDFEFAEMAGGDDGVSAGDAGHILFYGLDSLDFSDTPRAPRSGTSVLDWGLGQNDRVVAGYAHAWTWPETGYPTLPTSHYGCCIPYELPVQVARGKISFLGEEAHRENPLGARFSGGPLSDGGFRVWRSLLNMGYRLAITGGSDFGCLNEMVGLPRTLALLEGEPSYEGFLDAVREGRTTLVSGANDRVDLVVEGVRLGGEVRLERAAEVSLEITSDLVAADVGEILVNGESIGVIDLPAGNHTVAAAWPITESSWIAIRSANVQTSPVYVLVGGAPIRASASDACEMVHYIDHLKGLVAGGEVNLGADRESGLALYDDTRAQFYARYLEAGGGPADCE
jgi:hypothetical protein